MKRLIIVIIATLLAFAFVGCAKKASERLVENILEKAAGSQGSELDVDLSNEGLTIVGEDGDKWETDSEGKIDWPKEIPASIPEFKGSIISLMDMGGDWIISYEGVTTNDCSSYIDSLYKSGFEKEHELTAEASRTISGTLDGLTIMLSYDDSGFATLTISK